MADGDGERIGRVRGRGYRRRARAASLTMRCTWPLSARPWPQTDCFTRAGAYSVHSMPARGGGDHAAPRACPTESAMRASAPTNDSSSATASGACAAMSAATPSKMTRSRSSEPLARRGRPAPRRQCSDPPAAFVDDPVPASAVPGSMPRTSRAEGRLADGPRRERTSPVTAADAGSGPAPDAGLATAREPRPQPGLRDRLPRAPPRGCRSWRRRPGRRRCPRARRRAARLSSPSESSSSATVTFGTIESSADVTANPASSSACRTA